MPKNRTCPDCGQPWPEGALEDVCPVCSLRSALQSRSSAVVLEIPPPTSGLLPAEDSSSLATRHVPLATSFGDYELLEEIARGGLG